VREEKSKAHFRVTLREYQEGVGLNIRRATKGIAHVQVCGQSGEILLSVENLKYLGLASNGRPFYYEGWIVLKNGARISMGPISVNSKGLGKSCWQFTTNNISNTGAKTGDIAGVAVTVEMMHDRPQARSDYVLFGELNKGDELCFKPLPMPSSSKGFAGSPSMMAAMEIMRQATFASAAITKLPYHWQQVHVPGEQNVTPFMFGYRMDNTGIERLAFGFPGSFEQPPSCGEGGEWYPSGQEVPQGHWVYYREPYIAVQ
jgi:hypothetical protein